MEITLREYQLLALEVAKEVKRVCEALDIGYFITGGTLLGAVRHQGFIPWDDDFDFGMTRENYERFVALAPRQLDPRYYLQTGENDEQFGYVFAKVKRKDTHVHELLTDGLLARDGIFVDIFPYDPASFAATRSFHLRKLQLLSKAKLLKYGYRLNLLASSDLKKGVNTLLKLLPLSKESLERLIRAEITRGEKDGDSYYIARDGAFRGNYVFRRETIDETIILCFEGVSFPAPRDYDGLLSTAFGDYMTPLSESERGKGHSIRSVEIDLPYESYFSDASAP